MLRKMTEMLSWKQKIHSNSEVKEKEGVGAKGITDHREIGNQIFDAYFLHLLIVCLSLSRVLFLSFPLVLAAAHSSL